MTTSQTIAGLKGLLTKAQMGLDFTQNMASELNTHDREQYAVMIPDCELEIETLKEAIEYVSAYADLCR